MPYGQALALQLRLRGELTALPQAARRFGYLLCLEHPAVVTLGKRGEERDLLDARALRARGVAIHKVDRGGEATYHEPGQLVIYPIVPLQSAGLGVVDLIRAMASHMAQSVAPHGAEVAYDPDVPGLWTRGEGPLRRRRKMASVGMRVSRGVTTHGMAINLINAMHGFGWIVPCGAPSTPFCNLLELMPKPPTSPALERALFEQVRSDFVARFAAYLNCQIEPWEIAALPPPEEWAEELAVGGLSARDES